MSTLESQTIQKPDAETKARHWRRPHYNVVESAEAFEISVSVPGVNRSGIDISVDGDVLTLEASRGEAPNGWKALRRELPQGDYRLALKLNVPINESAIKAQVTDGILGLTLPKSEEVKPRKIKVS
jgi:HSP20 family molecular chaperone IbpA